ncbi:MAG TPA: preprotein translocase subunit SecG [Flavipsychrobacter sp.]|nr:preprotein translocase subunit SecG [Flavipsychrobacter sp.]
MIALITIVILLACVVLAFFILLQNPKGGGLSGTFGSLSSQVMGVKQSTDVMEKGTWATIGIIGALCILSVIFYEKPKTQDVNGGAPQHKTAPANQRSQQ